MKKRIIVMTGGSSGLGLYTVKKLLQDKNNRIIMGVRNGKQIPGTESLELDLANLQSVSRFATDVINNVGQAKIDSLILNAGITASSLNTRTVDGYEITFAVNHLAHYLLIRLLLNQMADNSVIEITTSGTHDPAEKTMMPPPVHADAELLAHPENDYTLVNKPVSDALRAYSASKLCNILTARFLTGMSEVISGSIRIIAYSPGPTPGTGLVRSGNFLIKAAWSLLSLPFFLVFMPQFNSRKKAGEILALLSTSAIISPEGKLYACLKRGKLTWPDPSELSKNDTLMKKLWEDSSRLVGL